MLCLQLNCAEMHITHNAHQLCVNTIVKALIWSHRWQIWISVNICYTCGLKVNQESFPACRGRHHTATDDRGDEESAIQEKHYAPRFMQIPADLSVEEGRFCRIDFKVNHHSRIRSLMLCCRHGKRLLFSNPGRRSANARCHLVPGW